MDWSVFIILAWAVSIWCGLAGIKSCEKLSCKVGCVICSLVSVLGFTLGAFDVLLIAWGEVSGGPPRVGGHAHPRVLCGGLFVVISAIGYCIFLAHGRAGDQYHIWHSSPNATPLNEDDWSDPPGSIIPVIVVIPRAWIFIRSHHENLQPLLSPVCT